jgi:hypothetical protein
VPDDTVIVQVDAGELSVAVREIERDPAAGLGGRAEATPAQTLGRLRLLSKTVREIGVEGISVLAAVGGLPHVEADGTFDETVFDGEDE